MNTTTTTANKPANLPSELWDRRIRWFGEQVDLLVRTTKELPPPSPTRMKRMCDHMARLAVAMAAADQRRDTTKVNTHGAGVR
jgi:hypothetical protein